MPTRKSGAFWRRELAPFLEAAPDFVGSEERISVPRRDLTITFLFEGGVAIKGTASTVQVNFNFAPLIILHQGRGNIDTVTRFDWTRFMGFELAWQRRDKGRRSKPHLFLVPGNGKRH
jgi:hypothetical protein